MKIFKTLSFLIFVFQFETAFSQEKCAEVFASSAQVSPAIRDLQTRLFLKVESLLRKAGFKDYHDFQNKVHEQAESYPKTYKMMTDDKVLFAIHAPEKFREQIAREGLRHSFETGNNYVGEAAYTTQRNGIEGDLAQMSASEYNKIATTEKPKYGLVRPPLDSPILPLLPFEYGKDVWILKKDLVKNRTTMTLWDSLNSNSEFSRIAKFLSKGLYRIKTTRWYQSIFIPWSMRELAIPMVEYAAQTSEQFGSPYIYKDAKEKQKMRTRMERSGLNSPDNQYENEKAPLVEDMLLKNYAPVMPSFGRGYLEIQVWGKLNNLKYIDSLIFYETPPSLEVYNYLTQHGVKVYDGRYSQENYDYISEHAHNSQSFTGPIPRPNQVPHPVLYRPEYLPE